MVATTEPPKAVTKVLTREEILKADKLAVEQVYVEEWGGNVCIKEMTGTERDAFEAGIISMKAGGKADVQMQDARAKLLVNVICDEKGTRMFRGDEVGVVGKLGAKKIDKLFEVASRLNGLSQKDVKELVEDLGDAQNGAATSG